MSRATRDCLGQPRDMLSLSVRTGPTQKDMLTALGARDWPGRTCLFFPGHAFLSAGHVHFLCHWVGWRPVRGTCPFFPRGMLIFRGKEWAYGRSGRHAHSFRGTCSFFAAKNGHMGDMSRLRSVGRACPVQPGAAWASRGTCPFFLERSGPAGGHAHSFPSAEKPPGRTCPLLTARPGHMGYMSGPWC